MNSLILTPDVSDTITTLVKATANYVADRIEIKKDREAYLYSIQENIKEIRDAANLHELQTALISNRSERDAMYARDKSIFDRSNQPHYYAMGCDHVLEVAQSVFTRFVTGGGDEAPRLAKTIMVYTPDKYIK